MNTSKPTAREIAKKGIRTLEDLARFQAALMSDVLEGRVSASKANRISAQVGKGLKALEDQRRKK